MSPLLIPKRHGQSQPQPRPGPQGEEYEILKAQQAARSAGDRFARDVLEKAGHLAYPFLRDPYS